MLTILSPFVNALGWPHKVSSIHALTCGWHSVRIGENIGVRCGSYLKLGACMTLIVTIIVVVYSLESNRVGGITT